MTMDKFEVVSPLGLEAVAQSGSAPRLPDLKGKTIGEFWNGVFKGDITFPVIRKLLKERYPDIQIVPFDAFPHARGADSLTHQREFARELAALAKEKGCDAVISGNGA
jgi:hypothetical protein